MAEVHADQRRVLRRQVDPPAADELAAARGLRRRIHPHLGGCTPVDCTRTDTASPAPDGRLVAIERLISCGGAAGSLEQEVRLKPSDGAGDEMEVVATTGPVYALRWRSSRELVVDVDPVDDLGGEPGEVRVILRRVEG